MCRRYQHEHLDLESAHARPSVPVGSQESLQTLQSDSEQRKESKEDVAWGPWERNVEGMRSILWRTLGRSGLWMLWVCQCGGRESLGRASSGEVLLKVDHIACNNWDRSRGRGIGDCMAGPGPTAPSAMPERIC